MDRLSRSLNDLINTLDELGSLGIHFIFYDNNLDTTTPTGKLVFQIIGAVAEFEKDIIRERVRGLVLSRLSNYAESAECQKVLQRVKEKIIA